MKLEKLEENLANANKANAVSKIESEANQGWDEEVAALYQARNVKLTREEQNFIKDYRKLEELEHEKSLKFL